LIIIKIQNKQISIDYDLLSKLEQINYNKRSLNIIVRYSKNESNDISYTLPYNEDYTITDYLITLLNYIRTVYLYEDDSVIILNQNEIKYRDELVILIDN